MKNIKRYNGKPTLAETWQVAAERLGYASPQDAVRQLYRYHRSTAKVGILMGFSATTAWKWLRNMGEPLLPRGGAHNHVGARIKYRLTFRGQTLSLSKWERETGISQKTLRQRLLAGWSVERILTTPLLPGRGRQRARRSK